ncbi:6-bladed beta-propeller [Mucilaginibacter psychrotolerans]|uniref:6-bladed beta-propeller n=1 Tax=Mucilaginibacter psychrotolerans TaxID=1524096 RepID=UPI0013051748|nr:6-bladed beta-propeller [Mucilaginibacter psychrotolerans]
MKNYRHIIYAVLTIACLSSCKREKPKGKYSDITDGKNNTTQVKLSEVAKSSEYVKLTAPDSILLTDDLNVDFYDKFLLVWDRATQRAFLFDRLGKYLKTISRQGKGPGEYVYLSGVKVDQQKNLAFILDAAQQKVIKIDLTTESFQEIKIKIKPIDMYLLGDGRILLFTPSSGRKLILNSHIYIIDYNGKVLGEQNLPDVVDEQDYISRAQVYSFHNKQHIWQTTTDDIFELDAQDKLKTVDLLWDDKMMPYDGRNNKELKKKYIKQYLLLRSVFESDNYYMINAIYKQTRRNLLYNKKTKKCMNVTFKDRLLDVGLINDIDGGMPFWPTGQGSETVFYSIVNPIKFQEVVSNSYTQAFPFKDAVSHKKMELLLKGLKEDDNPIIQIVYMK